MSYTLTCLCGNRELSTRRGCVEELTLNRNVGIGGDSRRPWQGGHFDYYIYCNVCGKVALGVSKLSGKDARRNAVREWEGKNNE